MLGSALTLVYIFLINRDAIDLRTGIIASFYVLLTLATLHTLRVPWLLFKRVRVKENPLSRWWGALGILFFFTFATIIAYTAAWYYTMQPKVELHTAPGTEHRRVVELEAKIKRLEPFREPQDSLRHKTIKLVNDLNLFWSQRPAPQQQPVQNPTTDEERERNAAWGRYWQKAKVDYTAGDFSERILGIVRDYKAKGVPTGFLEGQAEQPDRLMGAVLFGGYSLDGCDKYANELCQLRELAFHVNRHGQRIDPPDF